MPQDSAGRTRGLVGADAHRMSCVCKSGKHLCHTRVEFSQIKGFFVDPYEFRHQFSAQRA